MQMGVTLRQSREGRVDKKTDAAAAAAVTASERARERERERQRERERRRREGRRKDEEEGTSLGKIPPSSPVQSKGRLMKEGSALK